MLTSPEIDKLSEALAAAHTDFLPIVFNRKANYGRYADLTAVIDATDGALSKHGLVITQSPQFLDGRVLITTRLLHKSGQWIESSLSIKPDRDSAQTIGAATTYGRRYSLNAILGVSAEEDDDGNTASSNEPCRPQLEGAPKSYPKTAPIKETPQIESLEFNKDIPSWMEWLKRTLKSKLPHMEHPDVDWFAEKLHKQTMKTGLLDQLIKEKEKLDIEG